MDDNTIKVQAAGCGGNYYTSSYSSDNHGHESYGYGHKHVRKCPSCCFSLRAPRGPKSNIIYTFQLKSCCSILTGFIVKRNEENGTILVQLTESYSLSGDVVFPIGTLVEVVCSEIALIGPIVPLAD